MNFWKRIEQIGYSRAAAELDRQGFATAASQLREQARKERTQDH